MVRESIRMLGERLVEQGIIAAGQLRDALEKKRLSGKPLGQTIVELGLATEEQVAQVLSQQIGVDYIDVEKYKVEQSVLNAIPEDIIRRLHVMPLFKIGDTLTVASLDPLDVHLIDKLKRAARCNVDLVLGTSNGIKKAIDKYYGAIGSLEDVIRGIKAQEIATRKEEVTTKVEEVSKVDALLKEAERAPVIKVVNTILQQAIENYASDIHLEPEEDKFYLRYRIDGQLVDMPPPPKEMEAAVISRIKIMSNMDIAEKRLPQDGRIHITVSGREVDLRISSFPTIYGENISVRVLDRAVLLLELDKLGFEPEILDLFRKMITLPNGIILVTGPTGCGKTTTLYAALNTINDVSKNIITLEDPVEYRLERVRQSQIDVKTGLTFAGGLRSIVRQDPDIIMIGEIRDLETAEIAIRSALTGHLVFSTLHTNDAPSAIIRLVDMGVEPFLIASSVSGVLAQRLIRLLCKKCKQAYSPDKALFSRLGLDPKADYKFYKPVGCKECNDSGYKGRTGIYELLEPTDTIKEIILKESSSLAIKAQAIKEGMHTLRASGIHKVVKGITSLEEVLRVTEEAKSGKAE